jgi:sugar-specific transcriptional regulator TrmB/DNA-binding CsgD family transcriptional regulator
MHRASEQHGCARLCFQETVFANADTWPAIRPLRMTTYTPENRLLAEIGVSEQEEHAYRLLLALGSLTPPELGEALQLDAAESARVLDSLTSKRLAVRTAQSVPRFVPAAPEVAIEALILRKQAALERTRIAIALLKQEGDQTLRRCAANSVEVIVESSSIVQAHELLRRTAQHELRCLIPPPFIAWPGQSAGRDEASARASACLSVVDSTLLGDAAAGERVAARGPKDEYRVARSVPCRLMIADRHTALLSLDNAKPQGALLLVRPSPLLDGLNAMFDMVWAGAKRIEPATQAPRAADASAGTFSSELEELIPLLAAGLNDKEIAHRLRISARTLIRRVAKLHGMVEARSRFQAGWAVALRLHGITLPEGAVAERSESERNLLIEWCRRTVPRQRAQPDSGDVSNAPAPRLR